MGMCVGKKRSISNIGNETLQIVSQLAPDVVAAHDKACKMKKGYYIDPSTGHRVMTQFMHLKRGDCCGNECRHCPYEYVNVPKLMF